MATRTLVTTSQVGELADLRAFCLVVDLGSVTKAAASLRETKGAVSRRLLRLEQRLGVTLVRRSPRAVLATEEGLEFRGRLGAALDLLEQAHASLLATRKSPRGRVRLTAPNDYGTQVIAPVVARFLEEHPDITVDLLLTDRWLELDKERMDIAFRVAPGLPDSTLVSRRLTSVAALMVASPDYVRRHGSPRLPADLTHHRVLAFRSSGPIAPAFVRISDPTDVISVPPVAGVWASDSLFLRQLALLGSGIAVVPRAFVEDDLRERRLVPQLTEFELRSGLSLFMVGSQKATMSRQVRTFWDFVAGEFPVAESRAKPAPRASRGARLAT